MFLAFNFGDLIRVPFGYVLDWLYQFTANYGLSLILFALIVRLVLIPINAKSKKNMMKMSRLQPKIQEIQRKYPDDKQKQNEAVQKLQQEEGASMGCGGCLWSFVPLLILLPLYHVVRQPLQYMLHESVEAATAIVGVVKEALPGAFGSNGYYDEMVAASHISKFAQQIKDAGIQVADRTLEGPELCLPGHRPEPDPQLEALDLGQVDLERHWRRADPPDVRRFPGAADVAEPALQ